MDRQANLCAHSRLWCGLLFVNIALTVMVFFFGPWNLGVQKSLSSASYANPNLYPKNQSYTNSVHGGQGGITVNGQPVGGSTVQPGAPVWNYDATFSSTNINPVEIYPEGTQLHIIGVHEADRNNDGVWWVACSGIEPSSVAHKRCIEKEHRKTVYSQSNADPIDIQVIGVKPMVLVLSAYNSVTWNIKSTSSANIKKVILGGYEGQAVTGLPPEVPVEVYSRKTRPCASCTKRIGYFYHYKGAGPDFISFLNKIKKIAGLSPASFQGGYKARQFTIRPTTKTPLPVGVNAKVISDKEYEGSIQLGSGQIELPEGAWKVLVYGTEFIRSEEKEIVVLGNISNGKLNGLVAASLSINSNGRGFEKNKWCDQPDKYYSKVVSNNSKGEQECYWVDHVTNIWAQPVFGIAAQKLTDMKTAIPQVLVNAAYHEADESYSSTIYYLKNPEAFGVKAGRNVSYWEPVRLAEDRKKSEFVNEYVQSSQYWFQVLRSI